MSPRATDSPPRTRMTSVAVRLAIIGTVLFAGLFLVMWVPAWVGNEGWLVLYPLFLIAWLPVEAMAIAAVIAGIIGIVQSRRIHHRRSQLQSWITTFWATALGLLSLPTLWFGTFPYFLFLPEQWAVVS